jgi:hypothetical protein
LVLILRYIGLRHMIPNLNGARYSVSEVRRTGASAAATLQIFIKTHQLTCIPQILTPSDLLVVLSHFLR